MLPDVPPQMAIVVETTRKWNNCSKRRVIDS